MCGIFGAVGKEALRVDVDAALVSMRYRGPDRSDVRRFEGDEQCPPCVFGHNRLSILDLSDAAAQPMTSQNGDVTIVFNGEIYNHHKLREELTELGHTFRTRSDTEVIVEGYRAWGYGVIERLDGMFALGIHDRGRGRLLLARDRTGKKPLFYAHDSDLFLFASEIKAILAAGFRASVEVSALPALLTLGYVPPPKTLLTGVLQLPPASTLIKEAGSPPIVRSYWEPPFDQPRLSVSVEEAASEVRKLVRAAVKRRLEADVPLGAFLSGGIDSTVVVGVMASLLGRKVKTFSIGFLGDKRFDETHYARIASRAFDTEHTEFILEPSSFDLIEKLVALHDGPFGDSSAIPTSVVSMLARKHVTVALSGDGGDELFCGYARFLAAEAAETIPAPVMKIGSDLSKLVPTGKSDRSLTARAVRFLSVASRPLADRLFGWQSYFGSDLDLLLLPRVKDVVSLDEPIEWNRRLVQEVAGEGGHGTLLSQILAHNFKSYLPYDLLVKADRASMLHSLELRSPFLDTALIDYAARLPDNLLRRGTTTKWILKRAFADLIPDEIKTRGKMGFGVPLATWFRGGLKSYVQERFAPGAHLYEYVDPAYLAEMSDAHFEGRADHGHRLWLLLTLEQWLSTLRP